MKVFNSVSDLQAASLTAGQLTQTKRYFAGQDGGGATYLIKTAVDYAGTPDGYVDHTLSNGNIAVLQGKGSVTFSIPTDFPDLQSAVDALSAVRSSVEITLNIETGHALTKGLQVKNGDYSNFKITSTDATVSLSGSFTTVGISEPDYVVGITSASTHYPLFYGYECVMPQLFCLIDMGNSYGEGYLVVNSRGFIAENCGVINAGGRGLNARNSTVFADRTNWSGANSTGVRAQLASTVSVGSANISNCCVTLEQTNGAVYVSRASNVELRFATVTGSGGVGMTVRRSVVSAADTDFSNAATEGVSVESASNVDLIGATITGCGTNGVICEFNSNVSLHSATVTATSTDVVIRSKGTVGVNSATTTTLGAVSDSTLADFGGVDYFNVESDRGLLSYENGVDSIAYFSNAQGESRRYADGTQIVTMNFSLAYLDATQLYQTKSFPQTFVDTNYAVSVTLPTASGEWGVAGDRANVNFVGWSTRNTGNLTIVLNGSGFTNPTSTVSNVLVTCIGRWK